MVAHSGGPPLAMYLLTLWPQQGSLCGNDEYFFHRSGNAIKALPWLLLVKPDGNVLALMATCLLAILMAYGWVGGFTNS